MMLPIKDFWHKAVVALNHPQAADYSRIARRSTLAIAGFTIIEVLIVLAIAGLILLIVFLAVPALQRNSRNNGHKQDAARIATAIENFLSNNDYLPGNETGTFSQANWQTDCENIGNDAGQLAQFGNSSGYITASNCAMNGFFSYNAINARSTLPPSNDGTGAQSYNAMLLIENQVCPASGFGTTTSTKAGSAKQAALIYTLETTSGSWNQACIQI